MRPRLARILSALALALAGVGAAAAAPAAAAQAPAASPGCGKQTAPTRFTASFQVDGVQRTALVNVPAGAGGGRPQPLLFMFHGAGGNAENTESYSGLTPATAAAGFIVVYPNANGKYWNLTGGGRQGNDDVEFVRSLLEQLDTVVCVDDNRVYAAGVSNGGGFVSRVACELSDRLAGIASVAGLYGREPACQPRHPLSVLEVHGSADQTVPYAGWPAGAIASVVSFLAKWDQWDGCAPGPAPWHRLGPGALLTSKTGCAGGTTVAHVKLRGEPHAWPSITAWLAHSRGQVVPFDGAKALMQFFTSGTVGPQTLPPAPKHRR